MEINSIVNEYLKWIKENTKIKNKNGIDVITTPFALSNNDLIDIIVKKNNNEIILSDDGETLFNLEISGVNIVKRKEIFEKFLRSYGLNKTSEDEIIKKSSYQNIGRDINDFIQGILSIDDMFLTSSNNVKHFFKEDVALFFEKNDFYPSPDIKLVGKNNLEYNIDYIINRTKNKKEKLIRVINSNNKDKIISAIFAFEDLEERNSENIIIFNNTERELSNELEEVLKKKKIEVLNWTQKEKWIKEMIA
jgi:prophage protein